MCSNSLLGKLEQKSDKSRIVFASNNAEIENIFFSDQQIDNFFVINDNICELHVKPNILKLKPNRNSNCYLGAQVTAYARQIIHEKAQKVVNLNYKLFHVNCDSLMFSMPVSHTIPFEISHAVGDFKFEIEDEILSYYSLGNKCYSINTKGPFQIKTISKICGISVNGQSNETLINNEIFNLYIERFLYQETKSIKIPQKRFKRNFEKKNISQKLANITLSNQISVRRFVNVDDPHYKTFPFGYQLSS